MVNSQKIHCYLNPTEMLRFSGYQQRQYTISLQQFNCRHAFRRSLPASSAIYIQRFCETNAQKKGKLERQSIICRSQFIQDTPLAVAIGACVFNSVAFPLRESDNSGDKGDGDSMEDMRFAAMGIISFIPFFNWLSWVFAWLDTGRQRYLVYALVYLAPYINSELSLSPEDSWLPIASILACILHIQLEISIKNGELQDFQLFPGQRMLLESLRQKGMHKTFSRPFKKFQGSFKDEEGMRSREEHLPEETDEKETEEWDMKTKSFLEERLTKEKDGFRNMRHISKVRDKLHKNEDMDKS